MIKAKIMKYLSENDIVTRYQHGFVAKKSCFTNLRETLEVWTNALDSGYDVDVDYSKAFESAPHLRLIQKLKGYGIGGSLLLYFNEVIYI